MVAMMLTTTVVLSSVMFHAVEGTKTSWSESRMARLMMPLKNEVRQKAIAKRTADRKKLESRAAAKRTTETEDHTVESARTHITIDQIKALLLLDGEAECDAETGLLGGRLFACKDMNLVSFLDGEQLGKRFRGDADIEEGWDGTFVSDLWGWTDPETHIEYALVGMWDGTSIVSLADPLRPRPVLFVNTTDNVFSGWDNLWRDIKVIDDVMYVGSEVPVHGIEVFDLRTLRDLPVGGVSEDVAQPPPTIEAHYVARQVGATHNLVAAPSAGKLIAVGMHPEDPSCPDGSLAVFDVSGPSNRVAPRFETCFDDVGYVHDAQCLLYDGPDTDHVGKQICVLFAETSIVFLDLTTFEIINEFQYDTFGYVHQGWFSDDLRTLYTNDELDEIMRRRGYGITDYDHLDDDWTFVRDDDTVPKDVPDADYSRTFVFDVTDLDDVPTPSIYTTPSAHPSIDHNLYVKGEYIYHAAYTSGARVRKIIDAHTIEEVAFMDIETLCECVTNFFNASECECDPWGGTWTHYPHFNSGLTIAGNDKQGLFVLRPVLNQRGDDDASTDSSSKKKKSTSKTTETAALVAGVAALALALGVAIGVACARRTTGSACPADEPAVASASKAKAVATDEGAAEEIELPSTNTLV